MRNKIPFLSGFFMGMMSNTSIVASIISLSSKEILGSFPMFNPYLWGAWLFIRSPVIFWIGAVISSIYYGFTARHWYETGKM